MFISEAAHQLRNPAAAVQSMAEALRDAKTDEDKDKRIIELVAAAKNSATVAEQLLSLERLRQPTHQDQMDKIDFRAVVEEACADMGVHILTKGIDFEVTMPESTILVSGDRIFLAEAIKNLLDNALKHGGAKLSQISVVLRCDAGNVKLTVSDDGTGLSPDQSEAVFSRFSQLEYSEGSGLGLSIVSAVAKRHGGVVAINQVEKGASVTLELPIAL